MKLQISVLILSAFFCLGHANVLLKMGVSVTVTFEGDELEIRFDNPEGREEQIFLCFRSRINVISQTCPEGYETFGTIVREREIVFKLNRQGKIAWLQNWQQLGVIFEPDGSLKLMLALISSSTKVSLPNAEIPVVTTTTTITPPKETSNKAMIGIICVIVILILAIIIGAVLLYCWCNRRRHQPIPATAPEEGVHHARQESEEPLRQNVLIRSPALHPKLTRSTPLPSAAATKIPSTSTTKTSNEKPQVAVVPKPTPTTLVTRQTEDSNCVSIIPASAYGQRSILEPRSSQLRSKSSMKEVASINGSPKL